MLHRRDDMAGLDRRNLARRHLRRQKRVLAEGFGRAPGPPAAGDVECRTEDRAQARSPELRPQYVAVAPCRVTVEGCGNRNGRWQRGRIGVAAHQARRTVRSAAHGQAEQLGDIADGAGLGGRWRRKIAQLLIECAELAQRETSTAFRCVAAVGPGLCVTGLGSAVRALGGPDRRRAGGLRQQRHARQKQGCNRQPARQNPVHALSPMRSQVPLIRGWTRPASAYRFAMVSWARIPGSSRICPGVIPVNCLISRIMCDWS